MRLKEVLADKAHRVREYRNALVHVGGPPAPPLTLAECNRKLMAFLSEMPREW